MKQKKYLNPIASVVQKYQRIVPSPAHQAAILLMAGIPIAYLANRPIVNIAKHVAADPRVAAVSGMSNREMLQGIQQMQNNWVGKHAVPLAIGSLPAVTATMLAMNSDAPYYNLDTWKPTEKTGRLEKLSSLWQTQGYQPVVDMSLPINRGTTMDIINNNPYMQQSSYQKNLGVSIIAGANNQGNLTTLGSVYDSAVNKFDTKLSFQGVADKALKSTASGIMAGMFTDVIGSVMGMPQPMRRQVANSVGFGKALYQILN